MGKKRARMKEKKRKEKKRKGCYGHFINFVKRRSYFAKQPTKIVSPIKLLFDPKATKADSPIKLSRPLVWMMVGATQC